MRAIDRTLLRDLWRLRGQVLTIAMVVACGIASYVALYSAYRSLEWGRDSYYESSRFADVFVHLKRAPTELVRRIGDIAGVATVEDREVETIMLPLTDLPEPAIGRIVAMDGIGTLATKGSGPLLNVPYLRKGRMVEAGRADEVVVLEAFAIAHTLEPGDRLPAIVNGIRRELRVVGIALSPEYIFAVPDFGPMPDPARFAVLWMDRKVIAPAFQMEGAFNDAIVRLQPGESASCHGRD